MKCKSFAEKLIRRAIINKIKKIDEKNYISNGKHDKLYIHCKGQLAFRVKIPNDHDVVMHHEKSQYIAQSLGIDYSEFNELVQCTLSGASYQKKVCPDDAEIVQ